MIPCHLDHMKSSRTDCLFDDGKRFAEVPFAIAFPVSSSSSCFPADAVNRCRWSEVEGFESTAHAVNRWRQSEAEGFESTAHEVLEGGLAMESLKSSKIAVEQLVQQPLALVLARAYD